MGYCAVWEAFEEGCESVLWTDADAVIHNQLKSLEQWMDQDRHADVYWALSEPKPWCKPPKLPQESGSCPVEIFGRCMNSGAFIIRKTDWSKSFVSHMLQGSGPILERKCAHEKWNPSCGGDSAGDQCVATCELAERRAAQESSAGRFHCFGKHEDAPFQLIMAKWLWTFFFVTIPEGTFVINCHLNAKLMCVECASGGNCAQLDYKHFWVEEGGARFTVFAILIVIAIAALTVPICVMLALKYRKTPEGYPHTLMLIND